MAKYDVFRTPDGWLALDCQADTLSYLSTRLAIPLMLPENAPAPAERLNPSFDVAGQRYVMVTQFAASVPTTDLRNYVTNVASHEYEVGNALDMLISGF